MLELDARHALLGLKVEALGREGSQVEAHGLFGGRAAGVDRVLPVTAHCRDGPPAPTPAVHFPDLALDHARVVHLAGGQHKVNVEVARVAGFFARWSVDGPAHRDPITPPQIIRVCLRDRDLVRQAQAVRNRRLYHSCDASARMTLRTIHPPPVPKIWSSMASGEHVIGPSGVLAATLDVLDGTHGSVTRGAAGNTHAIMWSEHVSIWVE